MFCTKCGRKLPEGSKKCPVCDEERAREGNIPYEQAPETGYTEPNGSTHNGKPPKCTCCGYVGNWKLEPVFRPMDWAIGIIGGIITFGFGFAYLLVVGLIRSNKNQRDKICPNCKARNLWTFLY